ncbi:MAG TPA: hypothetical protein VGX48_11910 [Pyrinomonadaceae bacterium]|nr:hypothetical protein [Pyrinomonadaceae bacterium]
MAEETSRFIREQNIPLKGAAYEFYGSKSEQVFLLGSEEKLKPEAARGFRNTVAVINHKDAAGGGGFYVVEQEIRPGEVTFTLKKDSKVIQSLPVRLNPSGRVRAAQIGPGVGCKPSDCDAINGAEVNFDAQMVAMANQTCKRVSYCVQHCECFAGTMGISYVLKYVDPTAKSCWYANADYKSLSANLWLKVAEGPLLETALDAAIKKEVKLYNF